MNYSIDALVKHEPGKEICSMLGVGRSKLYRYLRDGGDETNAED